MFGGLVPIDAIVFTDFQWVTFHLDEESAYRTSGITQFLENGAVSTGRCNTGLEFICRGFKAQSFSRALIQAQRYFVEFGLRINR